MPFFQRSSTAAASAAVGAHHHRQLSLSSSPRDARIAEIRAETVAMANSGELTLSRSKSKNSSGHTVRSSASGRMYGSGHNRPLHSSGHLASPNTAGGGSLKVNQRIVAMEPDEDSSKHTKRIDQGILDASREALQVGYRLKSEQQQQQQGGMASWWKSFNNIVSPGTATSSPQQQLEKNVTNDPSDGILQRKTTVSRKFRV